MNRSKLKLVHTSAILAALGASALHWPAEPMRTKCEHLFGIAGGFDSCAVCGINPRHQRLRAR